MLVVIGIVTVFAAVLGGYLLEHGNPWVLMQPAELVIVGGAALGILLVANPSSVIRKMARGVSVVLRPPQHDQQFYLRHLRMLYEIFSYGQRAGVVALEKDVESPATSQKYGIRGVPTVMVFVDGERKAQHVGLTSRENLLKLIPQPQ